MVNFYINDKNGRGIEVKESEDINNMSTNLLPTVKIKRDGLYGLDDVIDGKKETRIPLKIAIKHISRIIVTLKF